MKNERIQEIKERQKVATSGPWQAEGKEIWRRGESYTANIGGHVWITDVEHAGNRDFIAHAPSDISYLLSEVERLQEENKTMKEALEQIDGSSMSQFANLEDMVKGIKLISRKAISHLKGE